MVECLGKQSAKPEVLPESWFCIRSRAGSDSKKKNVGKIHPNPAKTSKFVRFAKRRGQGCLSATMPSYQTRRTHWSYSAVQRGLQILSMCKEPHRLWIKTNVGCFVAWRNGRKVCFVRWGKVGTFDCKRKCFCFGWGFNVFSSEKEQGGTAAFEESCRTFCVTA